MARPAGLLLIDGNAIGFRANSQPKLSSGLMETQAIYGAVRIVRALIQTHQGFKPIVLWDGRSWRYDEYPAYKGDRDSDPAKKAERDSYRAQRPHITRLLHACGIAQRSASNLEADDLIALTVHAANGRIPIRISTGDRDLQQLVGPNVTVHLSIQRGDRRVTEVVTEKNFAEYSGYATPALYVQGKALIGGEDGLDGVDGIGKMAAQKICAHWPGVAEMVLAIRSEGEAAIPRELSRFRKKLLAFAEPGSDGLAIFKRNMRLMSLMKPEALPAPVDPRKTDPAVNRALFETLCDRLGFASMLKDPEGFLQPFHNSNFASKDQEHERG